MIINAKEIHDNDTIAHVLRKKLFREKVLHIAKSHLMSVFYQ